MRPKWPQFSDALPRSDAAEFPPTSEKAWPWNAWIFPDGTALVQTLTLPAAADHPARRIETRVLLKQESDWAGFSWLWNDAQTDATLVRKEGQRISLPGGEWSVPARTDCVLCHARGANYALGLTTAQLNREDQLTRFVSLGLVRTKQPDGTFSASMPKPSAELPRLVHPHDPTASLPDRVKAYFAANCSHCHRHEGGGNSSMDLSPWMEGAAQHLIASPPQHGDYGLSGAMLIAPGEPGKSVLPVRLTSRGPGQMPPVGTTKLDPQGTALIFQWLASLPATPQIPAK